MKNACWVLICQRVPSPCWSAQTERSRSSQDRWQPARCRRTRTVGRWWWSGCRRSATSAPPSHEPPPNPASACRSCPGLQTASTHGRECRGPCGDLAGSPAPAPAPRRSSPAGLSDGLAGSQQCQRALRRSSQVPSAGHDRPWALSVPSSRRLQN